MTLQRMDLMEVVPDAYQAVLGLEKYARSHVEPTLYELVKLRASMINGCAFCVDMHSHEAMEAGETAQRLFGLAAWRDGNFYTDAERAALALTDEATRLGEHGVTDEVWADATKHFTDAEVANLLIAIATINVWNRICVPTRREPAQR